MSEKDILEKFKSYLDTQIRLANRYLQVSLNDRSYEQVSKFANTLTTLNTLREYLAKLESNNETKEADASQTS